MKKTASCCGPARDKTQGCCEVAEKRPGAPDGPSSHKPVQRVFPQWNLSDHLGRIGCRVSGLRMGYSVAPGLYALGEPGEKSDIFVSANYKLSFDILRRSLKGLNAWILVLDTKGINVWCAAGKGTFGTEELVRRVHEAGLSGLVSHRRLIAPQLGAPGISAHEVRKRTGFRVYYGPVDAGDIRAYIDAGYKASEGMRAVRFPLIDRLALTPMEIIPSLKVYPLFALLMLFVFGLSPSGIVFRDALYWARPFLIMGLVSILAGAFITPALLPFIPSRSFAIKGWLSGIAMIAPAAWAFGLYHQTGVAATAFAFLFFPLAASYIALQFTGSTVFTGMSGVRKELKFSVPVYASAAFVSFVLLAIFKLEQWGVI
ncbi:MAG: mercury methylation corrinoid protein HgcA [Deltaproteobacteria bacterium]|nr:mercury methylation corrinoid protein HgcA [Deltaproteobacteria bacterium]